MYNTSLSGKVALITGGSRGIGRAIAIELSKAGAVVALTYKADFKAAENTLETIKAQGGIGTIICSDVRKASSAKEAVEEVVKAYGKIDILINNAGVSKIGLLIDMTEDEINEIIDTNLKGTINCSKYALNYMLYNRGGSIINISSIWGNVGASCEAVYSASKGGINSFTKALAKEGGPSNVRVNAIAPGVIETEMNSWLSAEEKQELIEDIPMSRFGTPEEIGKLAVFLASQASGYINGQVITVDGGM
jgi:3-oxoacyl-[acyl-carrier protein] reductase